MKKKISLLLGLSFMMLITGCSDISQSGKKETFSANPTVNDVLAQGIAAEGESSASEDSSALVSDNSESGSSDTQGTDNSTTIVNSSSYERSSGVSDNAPQPESIDESEVTLSSTEGVDIDLTEQSATVVYSEVYDMMYFPENYVGKTIKMDGLFTYYYDEAQDRYYFACIIMDATACCSQGIEFEPSSDFVFPDDFPEDGGDICVVGEFDTYEEDGFTYCTLRNAQIL